MVGGFGVAFGCRFGWHVVGVFLGGMWLGGSLGDIFGNIFERFFAKLFGYFFKEILAQPNATKMVAFGWKSDGIWLELFKGILRHLVGDIRKGNGPSLPLVLPSTLSALLRFSLSLPIFGCQRWRVSV